MINKEIHRWICEFVFREYMTADRNEMATELSISERMLDHALNREDSLEARLVFKLCLRYFIDHGIDINEVFRIFFYDDECGPFLEEAHASAE